MKIFLLLFLSFTSYTYASSYFEYYPIQRVYKKKLQVQYETNWNYGCDFYSRNPECFDACPMSYYGKTIVSGSIGYEARCFACPTGSEPQLEGLPTTDYDNAHAWDCIAYTCPKDYTLMGDVCAIEIQCQDDIYNPKCAPPVNQPKCLSNQEERKNENNQIYCLSACPLGSKRSATSDQCIFEELFEQGGNKGGCDGSVINSVKCLEEDTTDELDLVAQKTDSSLNKLLNNIKEYFSSDSSDGEDGEGNGGDTSVEFEPIELPLFDSFIEFDSFSIFPSNAYCPPDNSLHLLTSVYSFSYSKLCSYLNLLSNLVMLLAFYSGYKIVRGA